MGDISLPVEKFPSKKLTPKTRSVKRKSVKTRKPVTKPYLRIAGEWAAPRAKKLVVTGTKKGLDLLERGGKGAVSLTRSAYNRYKTRGVRRDVRLTKRQMIFRGDFYMRPGHVVVTESELKRLRGK